MAFSPVYIARSHRRLLSLRQPWPRRRCVAEQRDERAPELIEVQSDPPIGRDRAQQDIELTAPIFFELLF
jgi:hypothetical protein